MRLYEYEAKDLLRRAGLPVPDGQVVRHNEPLPQPTFPAVVKSQVPVGGRGKAGGVQVVENGDDYLETLNHLSVLEIGGYRPQVLLVEPKLVIEREHYISLLINRETVSVGLLVHPQGGVEVEGNVGGFLSTDLTRDTISDVAQRVAVIYDESKPELIERLLQRLYDCFVDNDAVLLEINPLVRTSTGDYVCADAKIELDDAAHFRHPDWNFEEKLKDVNFITLNAQGAVATIANGAGLAMATVDAVAAAGLQPANFLDIGGGADKASVRAALARIREYSQVRAIIINIFAGITRCDEVANAVIAAHREFSNMPPLFIRLSGTNIDAARTLLEAERIPLQPTLETCISAVKAKLT